MHEEMSLESELFHLYTHNRSAAVHEEMSRESELFHLCNIPTIEVPSLVTVCYIDVLNLEVIGQSSRGLRSVQLFVG